MGTYLVRAGTYVGEPAGSSEGRRVSSTDSRMLKGLISASIFSVKISAPNTDVTYTGG